MRKKMKEEILDRKVIIGAKPYLEIVELLYSDAYGMNHKYISVDRPGAVAIAAITDKQEIILVRQFRPPIGKYVLSLPAGLIDKNKDVLEIAKDELFEEAGFTAKRWKLARVMFNSAGILNEKVILFLAEGLRDVGAENNIHEGENIDVIKMPISGKAINRVFRLAHKYDCVVESSLIAHLAIAKELLR